MKTRIKVVIITIIILLGLITVSISANTSFEESQEESPLDITAQNNWGDPTTRCNRQLQSCCDLERSRNCC